MNDLFLLAALVPAGGLAAAQAAPDLLFSPSQHTIVWHPLQPDGARDNALADLDGDGALDHVTAMGKGTLRIAFGAGGGAFAPSIEVPVGPPAQKVAASDMDGDGDLDLLVVGKLSGSFDSSLVLLLNDGSGAFAAPVATPVGKKASDLYLGDFDVDGDVDVAVAVEGGVNVLLWDGTGTFQSVFEPDLPSLTMAAGDFDMDGAPDLAARSLLGVEYHRNDGTGAFEPPVTTPYAESSYLLEAGDYDTDGAPDLVTTVLAPFSVDTRVQAILNAGAGTFAPAPVVTVHFAGDRAAAIRPAETDGDGSLDLVLTTMVVVGSPSPQDPPSLVWARGDGAGGFTGSSHPIGTPVASFENNLHGLALGDVDGDMDLDAAVVAGLQYFVVFPGDGSGDFHGSEVATHVGSVSHAVLPDLNGDGYLDLAAATYDGQLAVALGDGDGAFGAPQFHDAGGSAETLVALDWDGDLDLDVLGVTGEGTVRLFRGDGTGAVLSTTDLDLGLSVSDTVHGDFDGDGAQDLVLLHPSQGNLVKRNVAGGFAAPIALNLCQSGNCTFILGGDAGDVNLDGALDLVFTRYESPTLGGRVDTYLGDGAGGFDFVAKTNLGLGPIDISLGDLNSDGFLDAVSSSSSSGAKSALGDGAGAFTFHEDLFSEVQLAKTFPVVLCDVNGDGELDLVSIYGGVRLGDGTGALVLQGVYPWPASPGAALCVGDVDADGTRDVVTFDHGVVYLTEGLAGCAGEIAAYGLASPGSGGFAPSLTVTGCASPGGTLRVRVENALGGAPAVLALGTAEVHVPFLNGYELLVGQVVATPHLPLAGAVAGAGVAEVVAALGTTPPGAFVTLQAFVLDPGATGSVASTNGVRIAVQ